MKPTFPCWFLQLIWHHTITRSDYVVMGLLSHAHSQAKAVGFAARSSAFIFIHASFNSTVNFALRRQNK